MKILYLSFNNPYLWTGVYRKEIEFCRAMSEACRSAGAEFNGLNIFTYQPSNLNVLPSHQVDCFEVREVDDRVQRFFSRIRFVRAFFRIRPVFRLACDKIRQFDPNIVIFRYDTSYIPAAFNPKKVKSNILFISEHHGKELEELHLSFAGWLRLPFQKKRTRQLFRTIDAVIGVTSEIAQYEAGLAKRALPYFVFTNGIDVKKYLAKNPLEFKGDIFKMIFVSSTIAPWHGLDRLLMGMHNYRGESRLELHLAGSETRAIRNLVKTLNLESQVIFHGLKHGRELDALFDHAHVAIGTLGLHRENLKYGATLKVREYMARGIPFVIGYRDEDIEDNFPLVLRFPSDDTPLEVDKMMELAKAAYGKYGVKISSVMREYALKRMDYQAKVEKLLNFCRQLLDKRSLT